MAEQRPVVWERGDGPVGDLLALETRIGPLQALTALAGPLFPHRPIASLASLRRVIEGYRREVLVPVELPAICQAFCHATRHELRELVALDQRLAGLPLPRDIVNASRRVGYAQLERLRALRDQRVLQRYRRAVERGEAHGWHTLVYGLGLHVYSLPLRQGLMSYTRQTLGSFVGSAAHSLGLPQGKSQEILMGLLIATAKAVDELLAVNGFAQVRLAGTRP